MTPVSRRGVPTDLRAFKKSQDLSREFLSGVSLHAHTHYSCESLAHLPRYVLQIPVVGTLFGREVEAHQRRSGSRVDFSKGWWHPPVSPRAVYDSEADQITALGLSPIVSVTDHDSLTAPLELQKTFAPRCSPLSFEWTVPIGDGFLHLGVHNLPTSKAMQWFERLEAFTTDQDVEPLGGLLEELTAVDDVLVVLNHPLWDLSDVGPEQHLRMVRRTLSQYGHLFHALELNGYRSWGENLDVVEMARETGIPLISGGDRHACAPNALINLSHASSFAGFVHEIKAGISTVMTMPAYAEHVIGRTISSVADVVTPYRSHPEGWRSWTDRISLLTSQGGSQLSQHWPDGGPLWLRAVMATVRIISWGPVRVPLAYVLEWRDRRAGAPTSMAWPPVTVSEAIGQAE